MSEWYCLNCRKVVETYMELFKGFAPTCKECGSSRLMKLDEMNEKEFNEFVEEFKKKTGEVD
ncbi:MAG: hypothetical protein COY38_02990 [Candidatus Aenigmarchaeota archaeon CG_4_10_14_0_8_um_filter_37_24]|nr:hypothetical protein [Candidatus Aenigmarchaeota archaeon]OIN88601.1 MAG: hypothetical protein AUJ50_00420 [Candidatus Aenigmarchaeota archaeon CG1_02_38_14]PIV67986.1 MAG: hypothetical protein COS07_05625 [Candidatus Aenigmarchaeota archaeon CG01_land_8_20_14_3_00_37_9]PIW41654.1 MAG: hypothetical protein COW21_00780 [Candidatus Aenigmarchaeota archaeon CG15_BIG_FIL_POST_REV_8_21_14_020_37_27]PIX50725.1 MAG: hypothetical protein COZ52_02625 [Candidatus Aenigmarchaeota archaeon CG_4_8_14_3_u